MQQFLSLANDYRRFVPQFNDLAVPLTELTKKDVDCHRDDRTEEAFQRLITTLCSAQTLSLPRQTSDFILDTDFQLPRLVVYSNKFRMVRRFWSLTPKKPSRQQRNCCATRQELLVIVIFLREFRNHLLAQTFFLLIDLADLVQGAPRTSNNTCTNSSSKSFLGRVANAGMQIPCLYPLLMMDSCDEYKRSVHLEDVLCWGCSYCSHWHHEWNVNLWKMWIMSFHLVDPVTWWTPATNQSQKESFSQPRQGPKES